MCTGKLSAIYGQSEKMDLFTFEMQDHQQYLPRTILERLFAQASPSQMNQNQSPRMSKTNPKSRNQRIKPEIPTEPSIILSDLPEAPISSFGVTNKLLAYLEVHIPQVNPRIIWHHNWLRLGRWNHRQYARTHGLFTTKPQSLPLSSHKLSR